MSVPTILVVLAYGSSLASGLTSFGNSSRVSTSSSSISPSSSRSDSSRMTITSSPSPITTSLSSNGSITAHFNSSYSLNGSSSALQSIYSAANECQNSWLAYWSAYEYALTKVGIKAQWQVAIFDEYSTSVRFGNFSTAANGLVFSLNPTYGSSPLGVKTTSTPATPESVVYPTGSIPVPSCCARTSMLAAQMTQSYSAALLSFEKERNLSPGTVVTMTSITTITSVSTSYLNPGTQIYYISDGLPRGRTTGASEVIETVSSLESSLSTSTQGGGVGAGFPSLAEWWSKSVSAIPNAALKPDQIEGMCNITYPVNCTQCVLYADKVELLYWPVSLTWKGNTSSTITPAVLPTTVYHGSTLSYGTAYLSYRNLADIACNMGSQYTEKIIAVPTNAVSVVQGWNQRVNLGIEMTTISMNMASLPPNPAASYLFDIGADPKRPNTMWDDKFDYRLLFPSQIRDVDPEWANCGYSWEATDDPPIALQSALSLTDTSSPTSLAQQESSSAKPAESAIPATASKSTVASSNTPKETSASTPDQTKVSDSNTPSTNASPAVASTSTTADIANAIASAIGLDKPTTTNSAPTDQIETSSQQEATNEQSTPGPVASAIIISNGQVLPASTATSAQTPAAETPSGSDPVTPGLAISGGQILSTATFIGQQTTPEPQAETQSDPEAVVVISGGQVQSTPTAAGGQFAPVSETGSANSGDQVLATIQLVGGSTIPAQAASINTLQTVIEGHTVQVVGTNSGIIVDSTSLQPGETTMIGTVPISVGTGFFEANSQTVSVPGPTELVNAELAGSLHSGELIIGSTTLTAGGAAITTSGHTYSVATGGLVQDGTTIAANAPPAASVLANGGVVVGSETLSVGGAALTTLGHTYSAASMGLVQDGNTISTTAFPAATVLADGGIIIGSTTLSAGGAAITTLGHTYSVGTAGLLQDGTTIVPNPATTKDSDVVSVLANGIAIVDSHTLTAGGPAITTLGHTYSLATAGLIRDGITISTAKPGTDSDLMTVLANGVVVVGSTSLTNGGAAITTLGHTISVGSSGVVRDGTTIPVSMWTSKSVASFTGSGGVQKLSSTSGGSPSTTSSIAAVSSTAEEASSLTAATFLSSDLTTAINPSTTSTSKKSSAKRVSSPTLLLMGASVVFSLLCVFR
ncbi:hypothetical protein FKW77_002070 [Venturia effusa]|uniref:Uncharacterized protein n=1 Tax=Venturia effusa TaxID=50376 RepID=A0A517LC03_9PEZI|nr:hypothetical protein FKW77_002070 [Venturia effusa]